MIREQLRIGPDKYGLVAGGFGSGNTKTVVINCKEFISKQEEKGEGGRRNDVGDRGGED